MRRLFLATALTALCGFVGGAVARADFSDSIHVFMNRFEYSNSSSTGPASIQTMMANAAALGVTDVQFQVRGRGDAFYDSLFEPRASSLTGNWDPLQTAITAAHANGIRLHAWINTLPLWNSATLPSASTSIEHMYHRDDPSFRIQFLDGSLEPAQGTGGGYSSVNPVLPEVHTHLNNVVNDIASRYAVDGIHLDYIRYIPGNSFSTLPHDATTHAMFQAAYPGLSPTNSANAPQYREFVKGRITDLVTSIKSTVDAAETTTGRTIELSASVWRDPDVGENDYLQDYRTWLENDLLDVVNPMIYLSSSNDDSLFAANLANTLNIPTTARVAPSLGVYLHTSAAGGVPLTRTQIERTYDMGADGVGFYGYTAMWNESLAASRRQTVAEFLDQFPDVPGDPGNMLDNFEVDEGRFSSSPTFSGTTTGVLAGSTIERVTSERQTGAASQKIDIVGNPAGWTLRHVSAGGNAASNASLPSTGYFGFWLKTDDSGLSVQVALDDSGTERSYEHPILGDGQWHLYQWNLADDPLWFSWTGGANGTLAANVTLDSIFFYGAGDATIYLDNVSHNPLGRLTSAAPPVIPGDFDGDGLVDGDDLSLWATGFGIPAGATLGDGDADGDGDVDGADLIVWQQAVGNSTSVQATHPAPEPSGVLLAGGLAASIALRFRKN